MTWIAEHAAGLLWTATALTFITWPAVAAHQPEKDNE